MSKAMSGYALRKINLSILGYKEYSEYLQSELWKSARTKILEMRKTCSICNRPSTVIHHTNYDIVTLMLENVEGLVFSNALVSLCQRCHMMIEFNTENNRKVTLERANARLRELLAGKKPTDGKECPKPFIGYGRNGYPLFPKRKRKKKAPKRIKPYLTKEQIRLLGLL